MKRSRPAFSRDFHQSRARTNLKYLSYRWPTSVLPNPVFAFGNMQFFGSVNTLIELAQFFIRRSEQLVVKEVAR